MNAGNNCCKFSFWFTSKLYFEHFLIKRIYNDWIWQTKDANLRQFLRDAKNSVFIVRMQIWHYNFLFDVLFLRTDSRRDIN